MNQSVLLVGSLAYDTVTSPAGSVENELGGSATYGGLAAAFHSRISNGGSVGIVGVVGDDCLLYTSPSPRDATLSRMPSSA